MKVLITGATGFVGSSLARRLVAAGADVCALARPTSNRARLGDLPVRWLVGDVLERDSLRGKFAGLDQIIHAAGMLGKAGVPESVYQRLHVAGTRNVLAEAAASGRARILYVSSPGVLGPTGRQGDPADETWPLAPSNPYERSKAAAEQVAAEFAQRGLPVIIARPEFIYGPGDDHVLGLFKAVQRGLFFYVDGGRHWCHPTYIDDAVAGMLLALECGRPGDIYHITGPRPVSFRELGETIARALDVRPPWLSMPRSVALAGAAGLEWLARAFGFTPPLSRTGAAFFSEDRRFCWQKARRELGYTPQFDFSAGVHRTVAWYLENGLL